MRRTFRSLGLVILSVTAMASPLPAHASHWLVDHAGGGDFTTIQAALDAGGRDSILVAAGAYPETLRIHPSVFSTRIVGLGEFGLVSLGSMLSTGQHGGAHVAVERLRVLGRVTITDSQSVAFEQCEFMSEVHSQATEGAANFDDCVFRGRTSFTDYNGMGVFRSLRFFSAPLYVRTGPTGPSRFENCDFTGPADTLVTVSLSTGQNAIIFDNCRFTSARIGVAFEESYWNTPIFKDCSFTHLSDAALSYVEDRSPSDCDICTSSLELMLMNSQIAHVGTGIRWRTWWPSRLDLDAVSIRHVVGDAIRARPGMSPPPHSPSFRNVQVEDCGGSGFVFERAVAYPQLMSFWIDSSRFTRCAGDGVRIEAAPHSDDLWLGRITNSISDHNGGAGFSLGRAGTALVGNIVFGNRSHGISLAAGSENAYRADTLLSNTAVGNGGDGIRVQRFGTGLGQVQHVARNIAALNGQTGIRVTYPSTPSDNLAWHNYLSDFVGFESWLDSNLVADPRFCDLSAGDFTLQADSPCAPSADHDLIGALPVACPSTVHAEGPAIGSSFALWPNPSSGPVRFALPPHASGRVEVHDLMGRLLWAHPVQPGVPVIWDGTFDGRAVPGGVYHARLIEPQGARTVRIIRLR